MIYRFDDVYISLEILEQSFPQDHYFYYSSYLLAPWRETLE